MKVTSGLKPSCNDSRTASPFAGPGSGDSYERKTQSRILQKITNQNRTGPRTDGSRGNARVLRTYHDAILSQSYKTTSSLSHSFLFLTTTFGTLSALSVNILAFLPCCCCRCCRRCRHRRWAGAGLWLPRCDVVA